MVRHKTIGEDRYALLEWVLPYKTKTIIIILFDEEDSGFVRPAIEDVVVLVVDVLYRMIPLF
jgi:hypothetical protein